jgi:hypothetical protein
MALIKQQKDDFIVDSSLTTEYNLGHVGLRIPNSQTFLHRLKDIGM